MHMPRCMSYLLSFLIHFSISCHISCWSFWLGMVVAFALSVLAGRFLYLKVEQHVPTWSTALRWQAGLVGTGLLVAVTNNGF